MGLNHLDDMSDLEKLGNQVHDVIPTLFHDAGHEILTCTETSRPPGAGSAAKRKKEEANFLTTSGNLEPMTSMLKPCWKKTSELKLSEQSAVPGNTPKPECMWVATVLCRCTKFQKLIFGKNLGTKLVT